MDAIAVEQLPRLQRRRMADISAVAVAFVAYALLCFPLRGWLIDDAAISMAYAANWTAGHGLVAQPGLTPVEGYSNFLWVVLLAAMNLAGVMTPLGIKAVSATLVGASLLSLHATTRLLIPSHAYVRAAVLLLVATSSAVVTWTTSGLENPLSLLLACELLRVVSKGILAGGTVRTAVCAGVLVAAMAMNRPDGIALAAFPPLALAMAGRKEWRLLLPYGGAILAIFAAFLAFRFATFGDWVPNTFYAKEAGSLDLVRSSLLAIHLLRGPFGSALLIIGLLALAYVQVRRGFDERLVAPLCLMAVSGGVFVLLPPDWMPDRRFATAFVPALFVFVGVVLAQLRADRFRAPIVAALLVIGVTVSIYRLEQLYARPTMPASVVERDSLKFNERARLLGLSDASILLPDIGAALLTSELRVYDLGGLIDPVVARTLHSDKGRFRDYVFEEIRPTFIKTHGPWAEYAAFDQDPRFLRDYVPIAEAMDADLLAGGVRLKSGEYVRRDALASAGDPNALAKLQRLQGGSR